MAIIKSVKGIGKNYSALKSLADYVGDKAILTSGVNCSDNFNTIAEEFKVTKEFYGKEEGRQYKHIIQSFKHGEVTPEKAHEIGVEFSKSFKGFEVFVATHNDKKHIHNHIVLNSVNLETGLKYHESKQDLEILKGISDKICLDNNLSVIDRNIKSKEILTYDIKTYKLLEDVKLGNKKSDLIDLALKIKLVASNCSNRETFISSLKKDGYEVEWKSEKKHITFTVPEDKLIGKKNKFRLENINKYFNREIFTKEGLENEFGRVRTTKEAPEYSKDKTRGFNIIERDESEIRKAMWIPKKIDSGIER